MIVTRHGSNTMHQEAADVNKRLYSNITFVFLICLKSIKTNLKDNHSRTGDEITTDFH